MGLERDRHPARAGRPAPADVEEPLEHGATVVVLSESFHERLRIAPQTLRELDDRGVPAHVRQTEEAVRLYGEPRERDGGRAHPLDLLIRAKRRGCYPGNPCVP